MDSEIAVSILSEELRRLEGKKKTMPLRCRNQIQHFAKTMDDIVPLLKDAESEVAEILRALYSVENVIDTFLLRSSSKRRKFLNVSCRIGSAAHSVEMKLKQAVSVLESWKRKNVSQEDSKSRSKSSKLEQKDASRLGSSSSSAFRVDLEHNRAQALSRNNLDGGKIKEEYIDEESGIVGLKDKTQEIKELLLRSNDSFLVSVLAKSGSGKTALVRAIYNSTEVKQNFQSRAWVHVTMDFDISRILVETLAQLTQADDAKTLSPEDLRDKVEHHLASRKYLIVLDDVNSLAVLDKLLAIFHRENNRSRVVLTTRTLRAARPRGRSVHCILLRPLTDTESWTLFKKRVHRDVENTGVESLRPEILELCSGTPLAILLIAGVLASKQSNYAEWAEVIQQMKKRQPRGTAVEYQPRTPSNTERRTEPKTMVTKRPAKGDEQLGVADLSNPAGAQQLEKRKKMPENHEATEKGHELKMLFPQFSFPKKRKLKRSSSAPKEKAERKEMPIEHATADGEEQPNLSAKEEQKGEEKKELIQESSSKTVQVKPEAQNENAQERDSVPLASTNEIMEEEEEDDDYDDGDDDDGDDENIDESVKDKSNKQGELSMKNNLSDILLMGYQHLQPALKCCLLYMCLIPQKDEIPLRRLLQLWLAEGLISSESDPEDVAKNYFEQLEDRSMIEVRRRRSDGSPRTCVVQKDVHQTLQQNATKYGYFHIHNENRNSSKAPGFNIRRLIELADIQNFTPSGDSCVDLRSYISLNPGRGDAPVHGVDNFLNKYVLKMRGFGLLTVLDLEKVYKPVLSKAIGKLIVLRYLGLRWTYLESIPASVGDLPQLEILDLKGTNLMTLPVKIWKAKKLRHLYMNEIHFDVSAQKLSIGESASLVELQTLWGLLIGNIPPPKSWLENMKKLKKLGLTCHKDSMETILDWISRLNNLQRLRLRSIDKFCEPSDLKLMKMDQHVNLLELHLVGKLSKSVAPNELPPNLKFLTLSVSQLQEDPMKVLGKLKYLNVLRLSACSYTGKSMTCLGGYFPELRVLKLRMLENLQTWTLEGGAMPELKELELRMCTKLSKPIGLEKLIKLREVKLINMSEAFVEDVKKYLKDNVYVEDCTYEFNPRWN